MVVKGKLDPEKLEKVVDGKEVKKEEVKTPLILQAKASKRKLGNEEKVQALLELMQNMNITLLIVATLEHNPSYIRVMNNFFSPNNVKFDKPKKHKG